MAANGTGWTCSNGPDVLCTRPTLGVVSSDITIVVRVGTGLAEGSTITNTALVDTSTPGDDPGQHHLATTSTSPPGPRPAKLLKTHRDDPALRLARPSRSHSSAQRRTVSGAAAHHRHRHVAGGSDVRLLAERGWTCQAAGHRVTCVLDGNAPLDARTAAPRLTLVAQIASGVTPGTFVNTAQVDVAITDPVPGNNDASDPVHVRAVVDLAVTNAEHWSVRIGAPLSVALKVTNHGPSTATSSRQPTPHLPAWRRSTCTPVAGRDVSGQQVTCRLDLPARLTSGLAAADPDLRRQRGGVPARRQHRHGHQRRPEEQPPPQHRDLTVTVPPQVDLLVSKTTPRPSWSAPG